MKAINEQKIIFKRAFVEDFSAIKELFTKSIEEGCSLNYNSRQLDAWISSIKDIKRWHKKIREHYFILAYFEGKLSGMCSLQNNDYLDLLFIHPEFQGRSIATHLFRKIEKEAKKKRGKLLKVHSSLSAKFFFQKMGFELIQKSYSLKNGEKLHYFVMTKEL